MAFIALHGATILSACGAPTPSTSPQPAIASDMRVAEAEVRAYVARYNGYYAANDLDRYFASFDPGLTQWWPTGRVDLKTYDREWREIVAAGGGNVRATVSDLRIQIDPTGDAAVATYVLEVVPRVGGRPGTKVERNQETDVLFRRNGAWKIVHVNYAPAAPAPSGQ